MKYTKTIDVVFIHPKSKSYVIWHGGNFYRLARMELTDASWHRRKPYTGSLEEIFVSSEACQASDERLVALGLVSIGLPIELKGASATKFLSWWTVNRYQFWQNHRPSDDVAQTAVPDSLSDISQHTFQHTKPSTQNHQNHQSDQRDDGKVEVLLSPTPPNKPDTKAVSKAEDIFDALLGDLMK